MNYYNEFDSKTANWLKELIKQGLIPNGDVDTRSITEIKPHELNGYTQCHFFAGIGGWSLALQLANWDSTRHVWTGSTPCQPFSTAGKGLAQADERHLWPVFFNLIKECRPEYVFGEQVASAIGKGWLDGVSTDLGEEGYTCGSAVLGAHSVGAPHIRQRLYWVAHSTSGQREELRDARDMQSEQSIQPASCDSASSGVAQPSDNGAGGGPREAGRCGGESVDAWTESLRQAYGEAGSSGADSRSASGASGMADAEGKGRFRNGGIAERSDDEFQWRQARERQFCESEPQGLCTVSGLANPESSGYEGNDVQPIRREWAETRDVSHASGSGSASHWNNHTLIPCRDGKSRRIESGTFPLVNGLSRGVVPSSDLGDEELQATAEQRIVRLKGYGNAIVPQVAAEFIAASIEAIAT